MYVQHLYHSLYSIYKEDMRKVWVTKWHRGWAYEAYDNLWGLMNEFDEDQKAALGIPRELDPWWEKDNNRDNFSARYRDQNRKTIG